MITGSKNKLGKVIIVIFWLFEAVLSVKYQSKQDFLNTYTLLKEDIIRVPKQKICSQSQHFHCKIIEIMVQDQKDNGKPLNYTIGL